MLKEIELRRDPLSNGVVLISNANRTSRSVTFAGSVNAGSIYDGKGKFGTAELVSRLLNRGTSESNSSELSRRVEEIGATLQFSNYEETISFSGRCHSHSLQRVLEVMYDCLTRPSFPPEEIEKVRAEVLADLEAEMDETRTAAHRGLMSLIYGRERPYGRNSLGTTEEVKRVTKEDILSFHERFYNPDGVILSVTGGLEYDGLLANVEDTLGSWEKTSQMNSQHSPDFSSQDFLDDPPQTETILMPHKSQVDLAFGARAVSRRSTEYYALSLGNLILGRIGLYGRLGKNVREEKGLAYYCYSALQSRSFSGHLGIYAGINPKNILEAIDGIAEEVERISTEALSNEELSNGKRNLEGSLSIALESSFERASIIHDIEYYKLGLDYVSKYPLLLEETSSDGILTLFQKYLRSERMHLAAAGPLTEQNQLDLQTRLARKRTEMHGN